MADRTRLMARIRRLMALGTRNSNVHEAARAQRLAQKLMRRNNISVADLSRSTIKESSCRQLYSDAEKIPEWLNALASVICMTTGCRCWFGWYARESKARDGIRSVKRRRSVHFYGFNERPEIAAYVFTVLLRQLRAKTEEHMSGQRRGRIKLQTLRNRADQFRIGWVTGVWQVLEAFTVSEEERTVLQGWLQQRFKTSELSSTSVREAGRCRGHEKARLAGLISGRQAELHHGLAVQRDRHLLTDRGADRD